VLAEAAIILKAVLGVLGINKRVGGAVIEWVSLWPRILL